MSTISQIQNSSSFNAKTITALKMMAAAVVTFIISRAFHLEEGYWATVTVAAITQAGSSQTVVKSIMRLLGTLIGAMAGFGLALIAHQNELLVMVFFFILVLVTSYAAVQPTRYAYAAIISGLTSVIVLSSSMIHGELIQIAYFRTLEVMLGIVVVFFINLIVCFSFRNKEHSLTDGLSTLPAEIGKFSWRFNYLLAALKIAVACTVTLAVWIYFRQPEGFWATVSCLLIMEESIKSTNVKAGLRIIGHFIAAGYGALAALLFSFVSPWWLLIPLGISFLVCGYLIGGRTKYSSLGTTMAIALAIMLLVGSSESASLHIVLARLFNVLFGVVVAVIATQYLHIDYFRRR